MAGKNPYVGLRPFDIDESYLFFGRDDQTLELLQRLHEHKFVAVVGSSGSGKSSLLRAGLIPALNGGFLVNNSDVWKVAIMKPGSLPLYNLADAILSELLGEVAEEQIRELKTNINSYGASAIVDLIVPLRKEKPFNFFLLVDQFEEIFRFSMSHSDSAKRDAAIDFVDVILELAAQKIIPFYVVLTMRSDFIGDCSQFYGLPEAMNQSQYLVPRLTREQLRKVIEGPAMLFGGRFDSALTSILLNRLGQKNAGKRNGSKDVLGNIQDELPILQHALMRMWNYEEHVENNTPLDLRSYEKIGGIEQALSNHADEAYKELSKKDKKIAKSLFKGLTAIDDYGRKIRRPALLSDLAALTNESPAKLLEIIDHFVRDGRSFLIVNKLGDTDDYLIDISHESLIRQWRTLEKWAEQEETKAKVYSKLIETKLEFTMGNKLLLDDRELQKFVEWRDRFKPNKSWASRYSDEVTFNESMTYIEVSERKQKFKRNKNRLLIATVVFLFAAAAYTFISRNIRERNKVYALKLHENAQGFIAKDPTIALLFEMAAYDVQQNEEYKDSARSIYNSGHSFYKVMEKNPPISIYRSTDKPIEQLISPSYDRIMTRYSSGQMTLRDLHGKVLLTIDSENVQSMNFSNDGSKCAIGRSTGEVHVWDTRNAETLWKFQPQKDVASITSLAFSNDNKLLITGNENGNTIMWDETGNKLFEKDLTAVNDYSVTILQFSPDNTRIFGSSFLNSVVFTQTTKTELTTGRYDESGLLNAASFHPTKDYLVTGGKDRVVRFWDFNNNVSKAFRGHKTEVVYVDFLIFGEISYLVSGSLDNTLILWNLEGEILQQFVGHDEPVTSVVIGEDKTSIITRSLDLTKRAWPLDSHALREIYEPGQKINEFSFEEIVKRSPPELPLDQFLTSGKIETLSVDILNEFGMN